MRIVTHSTATQLAMMTMACPNTGHQLALNACGLRLLVKLNCPLKFVALTSHRTFYFRTSSSSSRCMLLTNSSARPAVSLLCATPMHTAASLSHPLGQGWDARDHDRCSCKPSRFCRAYASTVAQVSTGSKSVLSRAVCSRLILLSIAATACYHPAACFLHFFLGADLGSYTRRFYLSGTPMPPTSDAH